MCEGGARGRGNGVGEIGRSQEEVCGGTCTFENQEEGEQLLWEIPGGWGQVSPGEGEGEGSLSTPWLWNSFHTMANTALGAGDTANKVDKVPALPEPTV